MFADDRKMNHGLPIVRFHDFKMNCSRTEVQMPRLLFQKIRYHFVENRNKPKYVSTFCGP